MSAKRPRNAVALSLGACGAAVSVGVSLAAFPPNYRIGNVAETEGCFNGQLGVVEALGISEDGNTTVGRGNKCNGGELRGWKLFLNAVPPSMPVLGTLGGSCSQAWAVIDTTRAVGSADEAAGANEWQRPASFVTGNVEDLGTLGELLSDTGHAFDIDRLNDINRVVGRSEDENGAVTATYWQQIAGVWQATNLGMLASDEQSEARGKNSNNDIVGFSQNAAGVQQGVIWEPNGPLSWTMTALPSLGGNSIAWNVNDSKVVVGVSGTNPTAVRWQLVGGVWQITALPTLSSNASTAYAINNPGDIVGFSQDAAGMQRAVVWSADGIHDLQQLVCRFVDYEPSLNWELKEARAINNNGKICGNALRNTGGLPFPKPFQLAPVCAGDVIRHESDEGDVVNIQDFLALLEAWGSSSCTPADINNDGTVNVVDFLALLQNWDCPDPSPESFPASAQQCIDRYWPDTVRIAACITALNLIP